MAIDSAIEWTEATWNPTTGCTKISPGCQNCYAATLSKRLKSMGVYKYRHDFKFTEQPDDIELPATWKKGKKIFVNSMSDLFHEKSRPEFIARCFAVMLKEDQHIYQVLTKRPQIMRKFSDLFKMAVAENIPNHIWMGVSVENEDYTWRIDELRKVNCELRFISFEPLLGPIGNIDLANIDWVIIGGESGVGFRTVQKDWILEIIKQCKEQQVAVFFKQWGGIRPKSGGREIDGVTFDEYPDFERNNPLKHVAFEEAFNELFTKKEAEKRQLTIVT